MEMKMVSKTAKSQRNYGESFKMWVYVISKFVRAFLNISLFSLVFVIVSFRCDDAKCISVPDLRGVSGSIA